jgi:hypothetical protein
MGIEFQMSADAAAEVFHVHQYPGPGHWSVSL